METSGRLPPLKRWPLDESRRLYLHHPARGEADAVQRKGALTMWAPAPDLAGSGISEFLLVRISPPLHVSEVPFLRQSSFHNEARLPDHVRDGLGTARRSLLSLVTSVIVAGSILREVASIVRVPGVFVA